MKKTICALLSLAILPGIFAQSVNNNVELKQLEVPNSPAFTLADFTPSLIQTPNTPKKFILGVAQSFADAGNAFPKNYSAEFTPYWWLKHSDASVYSLAGLKPQTNNAGNPSAFKQDPFHGLKFTGISIAFLNKDLIPDTIKAEQKMFSVGVRTTVIKLHPKKYYNALAAKISLWHDMALSELMTSPLLAQVAREPDTAKKRKLMENFLLKPSSTYKVAEEINEIILQKPIFSWDVASAFIAYGIGDTAWRKGRFGVWTNLSSFLPIALGDETEARKNYINLNFGVRFVSDNYFKDNKGQVRKANVVDVGGKIALELKGLTIGYEYFNRNGKGVAANETRSIGIISYQISDNLYINGGFGKNFTSNDKLISLLGLKWGLGRETISLPNQ